MSTRTDSVLVVGAGHIGIACAHYLALDGFNVTVVDQETVGGACSRANCGFLVPSHVLPLTSPAVLRKGIASVFQPRAAFRIKPQLRSSLYRWLFHFGRNCTRRQMLAAGGTLKTILDRSVDEYKTLFQQPGMLTDVHDEGLMFVFESDKAMRAFADEDAMLRDNFQLAARRVPGDELSSVEPALRDGLAGAYLYENDGFLDPANLNEAWVAKLKEQGVSFVEHCRVEAVGKRNGKIASLTTTNGELTADRYVFATGAWSSKIASDLDCDIPVEPGKGYSVTMPKPDGAPQYPMLFPEAHVGVTPFENELRIASMMEFVGFDETIPEFRIAQLQRSAKPYLRCPTGPARSDTWYGWRPMTWDSLPIVGRLPRLANGLIATGHNMLGLTLAPITGRMISDLICDRPTDLPVDALSPARFC